MFGMWAALPPEVNSARLTIGPGAAPMLAAAAAYTTLANGLRAIASSSQTHLQELMVTWRGPSAARAHSAFAPNLAWLYQHAAVLDAAAARCTAQATAHTAAVAATPPLPVIIANRVIQAQLAAATTVAAAASSGLATGLLTGAMAANEAAYQAMWVQASNAMYIYAGQTITNIAVVMPTVAPPITGGDLGAHAQPMLLKPRSGGSGGPGGPGPGSQPPGGAPQNPGGGTGDPGGSGTNPVGGKGVSSSTGPLDPLSPGQFEGLGDGMAEMLADPGFQGVSPGSSTLAALQGGTGGLGMIGLLGGGFGSMSGSATGFRMPAGWPAGPGTAFGAASSAVGATPVAPVAPRNASAPIAQQRRRTDEETRTRVFAAGDGHPLPEWEQPAAIGVIEYVDADADRELVS